MNSHSPFISETLFRPIKKCNPKIFVLLVLFFSINKFSLSQVNLQTGSATFSLPMFNWHDHKSNLTTMVGLSYNSGSGLKVNDVASEVGQGWSLIAGGVITRLQVGEPDDQVKYANGQVNAADPTENDIYKYPNGYLYANRKAYEGCPSALTKYPLYGAKNLLYKQYNSVTEDKQLDYFAFQFNGKSGMFVLNAAANNPADPAHEDIGLPLGDTKIKIKFQRASSPSPGTRNTITSFTIQDVDGLLYTFSRLGSTKLLNTKYCDRSGNYRQEQPKFKEGKVYYQNDYDDNVPQPYVVSSWYLTSITDSLTQPLRSVTFNYRTTDEDINAYAGADLSYNQSRDYSTVSFKRSISKKPRLESITYPDGHTVSFEYKKSRVDFNGSSALTAVNITYYNGIVSRTLSKYLINTTYFILNRYGTPVSDYQKSVARLCLKSVQKIGPDLKEDSPPYIFDYYTGSDASGDFVPPPFYYKKDVWGYYNADKSVNTHGGQLTKTSVVDLTKDEIVGLCFLREIAGNNNNYTTDFFNVKPDYAKNGLLKQIIYPTGGALTYDYAQNAVLLNSQNQQIGGVHVFQTGSTDGGSSNGCGNPIITTYNYINSTGGSSLWGFEMPANYSILYSFYSPYDKYYKFPVFGGCGIFGCCKYKFLFPGILSVQQATNLSDLMKLVEAISPVLGVIGSVSSVLNAIKVFTTSSGALAIVALVIDIITGLYTIYASCIRNQARTLDARTYSDYDLNSANPLPVQFKRVEVTESPGTNGKTVYQFTSDSDFPMWWAPTNPNFSSKQRFPAWAYGLPLSTTVFKANGDPVKATLYSYDTTYIRRKIKVYDLESGPNNASGLWTNLVSCKCQVLKTSSQRSTDYNDAAQYNSNYVPANGNSDMAVEMNAYYTGHVNLSQVREQVYNESSPSAYTETTTSYAYNDVYNGNVDYNSPGNYEVNTITVKKSNGDQLIKTIGYAIQGPQTDPAIAALTANNVVTLPFRTTMYLKRFGSSTQEYLSDSRTDFVQLSNKNVKPSRQVEVRYSQPNTPANNGQEIEVKKFVYDNTGNLIKVADEGGRTVSSLYDYDDKYATATIINSDAAADKVAYTSFETSNTGRWTIGGTAVYSTTQKVTGDRSFQISGSNSLSATSLSTSVAYRLSFWSTAALSVSGGGTQITAAPTINGFTYYEYEFPTGTTSISLTGSGAVDELRLYPKTARMSTVTYDPLIGKTSECDANNRITYYEYDNLGRMRFIRDEKRNIVKMYEYNNVSKQTGCPATFANHYVDEVFIKGNCGANSIGNEYHYTIAAGKYTSTISQEDADAKAQKELLEQGQNTANTSGTCRPNFCNDALSVTVYSEGCGVGFKGGAVTYTVPSGRYCTISKDSANALAGEEIDANAQAYANDPAHRVCVVDYDPDWQAEDNAPKECRLDNGQNYVFILATDVNPNSSTYGTTSWKNTGEQGSCAVIYCNIYYTNSTYDPQLITLTNINTGVQTTTRLYPMSTNALLANLPVGYYEVTIVNETTSNSHQYSICSSYFVSGNGATFGGVYLSTGCSTININ